MIRSHRFEDGATTDFLERRRAWTSPAPSCCVRQTTKRPRRVRQERRCLRPRHPAPLSTRCHRRYGSRPRNCGASAMSGGGCGRSICAQRSLALGDRNRSSLRLEPDAVVANRGNSGRPQADLVHRSCHRSQESESPQRVRRDGKHQHGDLADPNETTARGRNRRVVSIHADVQDLAQAFRPSEPDRQICSCRIREHVVECE